MKDYIRFQFKISFLFLVLGIALYIFGNAQIFKSAGIGSFVMGIMFFILGIVDFKDERR